MDGLYMAGSLLRDLASNRLRRLLSILGVIIGIGAVVASMAVVEGGREQLHQHLNKLGVNMVFFEDLHRPQIPEEMDIGGVEPPPPGMGAIGPGVPRQDSEETPQAKPPAVLDSSSKAPRQEDTLRLEDVGMVGRRLRGVVHLVPQTVLRSAVGRPGAEPFPVTIEGSTPEGRLVRNLELSRGRYISSVDLWDREEVCVLGSQVADQLFSGQDPMGRDVVAFGTRWRVVGVLKPKGKLMRFDYDKLVVLPLTAMQERTGLRQISAILIQADSSAAARDVQAALIPEVQQRLQHREPDSFRVFCQDELVQQQKKILSTFQILSISIAGFSLLVSGIGIMNIMLVSVRERTREIGIWKAVGATDTDVLLYFLGESVFTCLVGGVLGIALGMILGAHASGLIARNVAEVSSWSPIFKPAYFALAVGAAIVVGLLSGVFPAYAASRLEPVKALGYE